MESKRPPVALTTLAILVCTSLLASKPAQGATLSRSVDNTVNQLSADISPTSDRQSTDISPTSDQTQTVVRQSADPPVTSSDLPKQIPAPPQPPFASTPHYEQQIARFVWETPHFNTPYPPVIQT